MNTLGSPIKSETNEISLNKAMNGMMTKIMGGGGKEEEGIDPRTILLPCTPPPSSQRASRGGNGIVQKKGPSTPSSGRSLKHFHSLIENEDDHSPSPSPSSGKRKRESYKAIKWSAWEDKIIIKAVMERSEKGGIWNDVTNEINERRRLDHEDPRTVKSITCHWVGLKNKILGIFDG